MQDGSYPSLHEITLFRLAQEGLTNVARHAQARHATLSLKQDAQRLFLRIHDDGRGYDPAHRRMGLGIAGMQERVALLGGTLRIDTQPEQGTTVEAALPLPVSSVQERETMYA
jgi:two-component system, NarL family, sensor histidine kinase UhpB